MLYKKYHRNFVRQFKKGVKFVVYKNDKRCLRYTVERNPYYVYGNIHIAGCGFDLVLIFSDGSTINPNIRVENAV